MPRPRATYKLDLTAPKGAEAARLRQQRAILQRTFQLPAAIEGMLLGSLRLTHVRCGKPSCHCATGEGHPAWHLTVHVAGRPRVIHIPAAMAGEIQRQVEAGRAFDEAVREVCAANAALLLLARQQRRRR